jgi:hypothetical protein
MQLDLGVHVCVNMCGLWRVTSVCLAACSCMQKHRPHGCCMQLDLGVHVCVNMCGLWRVTSVCLHGCMLMHMHMH